MCLNAADFGEGSAAGSQCGHAVLMVDAACKGQEGDTSLLFWPAWLQAVSFVLCTRPPR